MTARQARFVEESVVDLNAKQAAILAGYSANSAEQQGSRLLTDVKVASAIQQGLEARSARTELTQDWVLTELRDTYYEARAQHQQAPPLRALELIGKHLGMFSDRLGVRMLEMQIIQAAHEFDIDPVELKAETMRLIELVDSQRRTT